MREAASILVINCGSSSVKFALVDPDSLHQRLKGQAEKLGTAESVLAWQGEQQGTRELGAADHRLALQALLSLLNDLDLPVSGIGHRVVHGGEQFSASCPVDEESLGILRAYQHLAPLHNPVNIQGIEAALEAFPDLPQVMVFDTAFHQTMPRQAYLYALPYRLYEEHGIRRYGFHGTSHRCVTARTAEALDMKASDLNLVTAHLGNGCSAAAVKGGVCVDTTMGLTPLEGLVMGTRCGDIDPSLPAYLGETLSLSPDAVTDLLNKQSGLLGLSGTSNDMRELLAREENGDERAALAVEVFVYRLAKAVAGLVVGLGRLDVLVFTGGIGENSVPVRERTLARLGHLGLHLDPESNHQHGRGRRGRITSGDTLPCAMVVPTDEEGLIAQDTAAWIGS